MEANEKEQELFLSKGYDFTNYAKSLHSPGGKHAVALDLSLANLFQKLTMECSGILGNPQWKHYRHMELLKKDQIRLSNGIWRSWHIQFQKSRKPLFCKFVIDPDIDMESHQYPQAVVIEGKYWKRTRQAVANEYRKWRLFYKQKNEWSTLRRIPNTVDTSAMLHPSTQQDNHRPGDNTMQVDEGTRLASALQSIEELSESIFGFPRPGDERSYMRPLLESTAMMQPNLEPLNPTLDEFLDRLEPMEVMFPLFTGNSATRLQTGNSNNFFIPSVPTIQQQPQPNTTPQYGNQYMTRAPQNNQSYTNQMGYPNDNFQLNPSDFLGVPHGQDVQISNEGEVMDISSTPVINFSQKPDNPNLYNTSPANPLYQQTPPSVTPLFPSQQVMLENSLMASYLPEESPPQPHPSLSSTPSTSSQAVQYGYPTPGQYDPSYPTTPMQQQQQTYCSHQVRKTSNETTTPIDPNYANLNGRRGSEHDSVGMVDPNVQLIAEQMRRLEKQQMEQLREIEKQQNIATGQYLQLLQQYVADSANQPSEQVQRDLITVLSNPMSVEILKSILLQEKEPQRTHTAGATPTVSIKRESLSPQQSSSDLKATCSLDPFSQQVISLSQLPKDNHADDFQTSLLMAAAAAQVNAATPTSSSTTQQPYTDTKMKSPEGESSLSLLKKFKNARNLTPNEKRVYQELRRQSHITAEQKRRGSIKNGFEHLQSLVINSSQYPSGKVSKAVLLEKTIEYLEQKHNERDLKKKRIQELKTDIQQLHQAITKCQQQLPVTGVPVARQRYEENKQLFKNYVQQRIQQNYKFWIYSFIIEQLFDTYNTTVSTASPEAFYQSVLTWFDQNCSLPALRPIIMNSLRELSVKTSILSDPSKVPDQLSSYAKRTQT